MDHAIFFIKGFSMGMPIQQNGIPFEVRAKGPMLKMNLVALERQFSGIRQFNP